ncbi:hormogonium polysaccharide biosynthesis protein HpsA [Nodosilinea sp. AN01ver1]|uniref:hormogonium polysaccharide biosynthesis protein HpsA n=1 Tax=Nodosilinea sp. AN01ver1 TaxID=3423362 RepID=UPI003D31C84A
MSRHLLRQALRLPQAAVKRLVTGLLQLVLLANRPARLARSGFVLPTTVLLVLMVVLTATALTYRSFTRSDMAISQREQQVISNAATPAVDRAKAKIEFLFQTDNRFPSGVPASDILADLMLITNTYAGYTGRVTRLPGANDPYTLPDETRVDINGDGELDNAWSFNIDLNGDGTVASNELVVYSILVDEAGPKAATTVRVDGPVNQAKADALVTRTGPLATTEASAACAGALAEGGWQVVQQGNNSTLQKNFQVNAFVANLNDANRTFETLEFQQSRTAARANKWGAWFRYDLDVSPGPEFNWNGAMHTDGNFFTFAGSGTGAGDGYRSHMISSHNSCLYSQEASEISLSEVDLNGDDRGVPGTVVNGQQEFQGQAVRGTMRFDNTTSGSPSIIHVWNGAGVAAKIDLTLGNNNDSVRTSGSDNNVRPSDVAMNPLALFTRDVTEHINPSAWQRDPNWDANNANGFKTRERIINDQVARPFVDDFYRADNRWGPKPRYDSRDTTLDVTNNAATIGDRITGLGRLTDTDNGLDGYWERQAIKTGMRLIVGQRLELGNANVWNSSPVGAALTADNGADPLYPAKVRPAADNRFGLSHEYLQRKALRDNLAAVQGMVVYHYQINDGTFPAACVASTAHPGTAQTILNSRTFANYPTATTRLRADFLTGTGTNGWEFKFPEAYNTESEFAGAIASGEPLGNALRNLAYFAGDPKGGAPSFKPVQDVAGAVGSEVHPAPYLNMWGDFSPLRRVFAEYLDASPAVTYANLSPADKATLHSAACTVSLLAYNIQSDILEARALADNPGFNFQNIGSNMRNAVMRISNYMSSTSNDPLIRAGLRVSELFAILGKSRPWVDNNIDNAACETGFTDAAGYQRECDFGEYFAEYTREDWIKILSSDATTATPAEVTLIANFAEKIDFLTSTIRDRELGFRQGLPATSLSPSTAPGNFVNWDGTTGYTAPIQLPNYDAKFKLRCDPNFYSKTVAGGSGGGDDVAVFGYIGCSQSTVMAVRHPSLYYLFPLVNHDLDGDGRTQQPDGTVFPIPQGAEEYITNPYVRAVNPPGSTTVIFRRVGSGTDPVADVDNLAAVPASATASTWTIPAASTTGAPTTANISDQAQAFKILGPSGAVIRVPFLDKGVYNGREQLNARVLDIDIEALTRRTTSGGDFWLSANPDNRGEGVVFAFREDAVREDEITRPKNATATVTAAYCQNQDGSGPVRFNIETQQTCHMRVEPGTTPVFQDPPLTTELISLKPVDFFADPERRAHGFRLRTFSGNPADFSGTAFARRVGMTFVTDNSVYIQGDFNPHSTTGGVDNIIEEFTDTLYDKTPAAAFGLPFYNNRTANELNTGTFATLTSDHWRPVEILADAITVLSGSFKDGAVEDTFTKARPASAGGANSSYMNQNRPTLTADQTNWVRESAATGAPVWVDRNGTYYRSNMTTGSPIQPFYSVYNSNSDWTNFSTATSERHRNTQRATETFVNGTFVSGLVPQRPQQGYGGLHNFLRFLEDWNDNVELHIAGSLIQLNFSTNATGPFEHDLWHPSAALPPTDEALGYYKPPSRRWGYDVALLYVPPAPAARRFVSIGTPRSEYYRELPADDPYIVNLRCARNAAGARLMPNLCTRA